jgi:hypothetical protein
MKKSKNKSLSYLKSDGGSKKDKEIKKYKRKIKGLIILLIIVGIVALTQIVQNMFQSTGTSTNSVVIKSYINETILNNTNGATNNVVCQESLTSVIIKGITTFMNKLFDSPGGFWVKFFIFLGIIYLIQVIFSLVFDVIELVLLVFVAIKRLLVWIYKKITGRSKENEQLKKIAEL